eukprot:CAMPEP_0184309366 /NCGR_PEP_ID=MMETSP1049-20130417/17550_1 /TAXON_ID=77928 /ORGANISM="Proteomonas sulcata, Strain CCMP704" /LENGTH=264 /DNA_ID=CAMNT_0026622241 /DNA_START=45 /DNA_END=839 /DNA_ORIENTATION=+
MKPPSASQHEGGREQKGNGSPHFELERGPIKQVQRAIEKCVRAYGRDAEHLTDLVRCRMVVQTVPDLLSLFDRIQHMSVVGLSYDDYRGSKVVDMTDEGKQRQKEEFVAAKSVWMTKEEASTFYEEVFNLNNEVKQASNEGNTKGQKKSEGDDQANDESNEEGRNKPPQEKQPRIFRLVRIKNRFADNSAAYDANLGYRDLSLNLEVGWISENGRVSFLPVREWAKTEGTQRHVFEVQILLKSFHRIATDRHGIYELYRNMTGK